MQHNSENPDPFYNNFKLAFGNHTHVGIYKDWNPPVSDVNRFGRHVLKVKFEETMSSTLIYCLFINFKLLKALNTLC